MKYLLIAIIRAYQYISRIPVISSVFLSGSGCRSWPTCSEYAVIVIQQEGAIRGSWKAFLRVLHCNPFYELTF